ncbi:hypothetical protein ACQR1I_20215 [Bradyrhizobium sp. HKCCYLS2038]|uniref:hypothetical protein n=1 Tax=unclassified Bradyrhizobium TaxID=2631580 RepID=UPI003EBDAF1B
MPRTELHHFDDTPEDCGTTNADFYLRERIALLIDENERLRRIAAELAHQTGRVRWPSLGPS